MPFNDTDKTVFVDRRGGLICGCWTIRQYAGQEEILESDPEVVTFRNPPPPSADDREAAALAALNGGGVGPVDQQKLLKAMVINFTARALGVAPGALTALQLQTERARIAAIYKNL